jgi:uncharacterized protein (DUF58 family)
MSYKMKCTKRGNYLMFTPYYESRHPLNVTNVRRGGGESEGTLTVRPKLLNVRRIRDPRMISNIPLPVGSIAKGGLPTTDFREIREYFYGDPYNSINWKVTARYSSKRLKSLYVNVFEKEGRKVVWIVLDASLSMSIGTNVRNALDCAVEAASALSHFYLERGCSVGLYICTREGIIIPPDVGRKQYQLILKELIKVQPSFSPQSIAAAIKYCSRYSMGTNPLFIIIASLTPILGPSLIQGVKLARKYLRQVKRRYSVIVIDVNPYDLICKRAEEKITSKTLITFTTQEACTIMHSGALFIRWNPMKHEFSKLMLKGMRA